MRKYYNKWRIPIKHLDHGFSTSYLSWSFFSLLPTSLRWSVSILRDRTRILLNLSLLLICNFFYFLFRFSCLGRFIGFTDWQFRSNQNEWKGTRWFSCNIISICRNGEEVRRIWWRSLFLVLNYLLLIDVYLVWLGLFMH